MALGKFIKINGTVMPNPTEYSEQFENLEKVNKSEAGTDLILVQRLMKLNVTMTFQVSRMMYDKIKQFCTLMTCDFYMDGTRYVGRLRLTGGNLEPESYNTDGYWTISVTFTEK